MNRKYAIGTISILLTAAVALGGSALAASQDAQRPTGHHAQATDSSASVSAACQQMVTAAHGYMADVQQMMSRMHQGQASGETDESHGMMGGSSGMAGGSHGMMGGSSGTMSGSHGMNGMTPGIMDNLAGMMESMMGTMGTMANTDPSTIDDAATAEQEARVLDAMVANMRPHLDQMEARAAALRKRAAEIR